MFVDGRSGPGRDLRLTRFGFTFSGETFPPQGETLDAVLLLEIKALTRSGFTFSPFFRIYLN